MFKRIKIMLEDRKLTKINNDILEIAQKYDFALQLRAINYWQTVFGEERSFNEHIDFIADSKTPALKLYKILMPGIYAHAYAVNDSVSSILVWCCLSEKVNFEDFATQINPYGVLPTATIKMHQAVNSIITSSSWSIV